MNKQKPNLEDLSVEELESRLEANGIASAPQQKRKVVLQPKVDIKIKPKEPEIIPIVNLRHIPQGWKNEFIELLQKRQLSLAKHLFVNISSLEAAIPVAIEDASDCIRMATNSEGVELTIGKVQPLLQKIAEISVLRFLCVEMQLSANDTQALVDELLGNKNEELSKLQKLANMLRQSQVGPVGMREVPTKIQSQDRHRVVSRADPNANRRNKSKLDTKR